jgi:NAD(P)H dehydrogenase (quinone)
MKNLIIYAHPNEKSYNASILTHIEKELERRKETVDVIDLYKEKFNPVMDENELALYSTGGFIDPKVGEYRQKIEAADHLIFIFPVWWYDLPAILKGFMDKVLLKNWAYEYSKAGLPVGKLTFIKKTTVITTMKSPGWYYWLLYRNSIRYHFIQGTLKFCGMITPVSDAQCFMKCGLGFGKLVPFNYKLHVGLPACL